MSSSSSPFSPPPSPSRFRRSITCFYLTLCTWFSSLLPSPMPRYDEESGRRMSFHPLEAVYRSWFDRPPPLVNLDGTPINPVPSPLVAWFRSKLTHASASSKLFVTFLRSKFTRDSSSSKKVSDLRRRGFPIGKSKSKSKRISKFTPDSSSSNHRYYGSVNWDHFTAILAVFLASSMKWETALKIAVLLMGFLVPTWHQLEISSQCCSIFLDQLGYLSTTLWLTCGVYSVNSQQIHIVALQG
ncbi:hypothetical protein P8452_00219 [Trifolium repens]|nr:hypothetical protein P8452_00219 [Trifolium repens]